MKAIQIAGYGGSEVLELGERARPSPGARQLLVRVHAAGVNPVDWKLRRGRLRWVIRPEFPWVPGVELCGEVVEAGPGTELFVPGDWIFARLSARAGGAYAEYAVVDEGLVARKPQGLTPTEVAGLPLAGTTALQALRKGGLAPGQRLLVIGASGGIGHLAVQIGRIFEARVTAVTSTRNLDWVRALGAERVLDYTREDYRQGPAEFDVILDAVAASSFWALAGRLAPSGVYLTTLPSARWAASRLLPPLVTRRRSRLVVAQASAKDLELLAQFAEEGSLAPVIEAILPLSQARAAHELSETRRARGKIVLEVVPQPVRPRTFSGG